MFDLSYPGPMKSLSSCKFLHFPLMSISDNILLKAVLTKEHGTAKCKTDSCAPNETSAPNVVVKGSRHDDQGMNVSESQSQITAITPKQ